MILTESGQRQTVSVPFDMKIENFLKEYLNKISDRADSSSIRTHLELYKHTLLVSRNGIDQEVSSDKTLRQAGVNNGDICKVSIKIRPEFASRVLGE